ncbi:hypothetical protein [Blastochloris tepida]|uniref:Uncharacterized protein n=1 Tax=Blastochloris tepida TaxID=2233851 RepID=A0A348FYU5_9HYPH|nr:hypothetical protein [Blastochloris tepida]BBF92478.1 hypothetical protein BLTE_11630 [Blastochloris tepida]
MPALVAGIHVLKTYLKTKTWMAGTSPAMTAAGLCQTPQAQVTPKEIAFRLDLSRPRRFKSVNAVALAGEGGERSSDREAGEG